MEDYEKLGAFYLGREYDLSSKELGDIVLYDSKDLSTHGVCVGMTGSGKTGLCIGILEEAAIDSIPAIAIDPKGDLTNLLLTFPDLAPEDFRPWINEDEAEKKGLTPEEFAAKQAETWKNGITEWGQEPDRIRRLKESCDFTIYTPGSTAGIPMSILKSFAGPSAAVREDEETLRDRIGTTVASLLSLVGIDADPIKSREHVLLSNIFDTAWQEGRSLDLAGLIGEIQDPPFEKVGMLDLEAFYPSKDRFGLATLFNNLLAAPTFQTWMEGESLDIERLLFTAEGRPRISVISIAHLSDAERMFFVSLLLNEIIGWMRAKPGTGSLRALLYMDEIFGFFPPVAEPPSKKPLLTLLKQARAYGLGVLLATQNPVDLDYKGLANTGTWLIGRLQTQNDIDRLLDGLQGVAAGSENRFDRREMAQTLAGLGKRVFLLYNVHDDAPAVFQTRWTLSYLAGPLTRAQIKTLMDPRRDEFATEEPAAAATGGAAAETPGGAAADTETAPDAAATEPTPSPSAPTEPPAVPADIPQFYLPLRGGAPAGAGLVYRPSILASAAVNFVSSGTGVAATEKMVRAAEAPEGGLAADWDAALELDFSVDELDRQPYPGGEYSALPAGLDKVTPYRSLKTDFSSWVYRTQAMRLMRSPGFKLTSDPGETEGEFRSRLQLVAREKRDAQADRLRAKYASKMNTLEQQVFRAEQKVEKHQDQARARKMQTAISVGATVLSAFTGRKTLSASNIGRATTAARDVGRTMDRQADIKRAEESLEVVLQRQADLEAEFQAELDALEEQLDPQTEEFEEVMIRPRKTDIAVDTLGLIWLPYWRDPSGSITTAWG